MIANARVTVGTTPTLLTTAEKDAQAGSRLHIRNTSELSSVWLGGSGVTTGTGLELSALASLAVTLDSGDALYAVAAVGTVEIQVLRIGV